MKNEQRREQTTRLLLETAKALLQDKSCHAITMQDIMEKSSLSKGAIFHYVKSKDELFAWVLLDRLEELNASFLKEAAHAPASFEGPMSAIAGNLARLEDAGDITNKVLMYLLGREDDPAVAEALRQFYDRSASLSGEWIRKGQEQGVIRASIDPRKTADLLVLLSLGLRVRAGFPEGGAAAEDVSDFIAALLKAK
ncbi:TetR/AcrR family transcriptional regulator [Paenibacillus protaetiae]|uniref:TetR/AcrR family transcriptional regulator n=1 Tax=Paenibacillus protaetiae TaxID=2509456 RepID=A0A4P6EUA1_9BACL|nr:TetR/AcrR family transcriptional regulator [Paenibacillus protaetiae]QAY66504.1 TetR/AcrR family transcriptional regulator [Paenibacillus protaetiae]